MLRQRQIVTLAAWPAAINTAHRHAAGVGPAGDKPGRAAALPTLAKDTAAHW
ncbi:MAG: hypothetical protein ACRDRI_16670 [Pseudonocardiaceae bacterium]